MADSPTIPAATPTYRPASARPAPRAIPTQPIGPVPEDAVEVAYEPCDWAPAEDGRISEALYDGSGLQSIRIPNAKPHPTRPGQSEARAPVAPPKPSSRPHPPAAGMAAGLLSAPHPDSPFMSCGAHAQLP